jgi:hypothetical protein
MMSRNRTLRHRREFKFIFFPWICWNQQTIWFSSEDDSSDSDDSDCTCHFPSLDAMRTLWRFNDIHLASDDDSDSSSSSDDPDSGSDRIHLNIRLFHPLLIYLLQASDQASDSSSDDSDSGMI